MEATGIIPLGRISPVGHNLLGHPTAVLRDGKCLDRGRGVRFGERSAFDWDVIRLCPIGLTKPLGKLFPPHQRRSRA